MKNSTLFPLAGYPEPPVDWQRPAGASREPMTEPSHGIMTGPDGRPIGTWKRVAAWRVKSWVGYCMYQIEAVVNGKVYTGRGFGVGMLWKGRLKAGQ